MFLAALVGCIGVARCLNCLPAAASDIPTRYGPPLVARCAWRSDMRHEEFLKLACAFMHPAQANEGS